MCNALHPGRRTSGIGLSVPRVCLGLLLLASVGAGAQTVAPTPTFDPRAGSNQLDTNLVLTFPIPEGFEKADGSALLLSQSGKPVDAVRGSFKVPQEAEAVTAEFRVQRGRSQKTFSGIELDGQPFSFSKAVVVDPFLPRSLEIKPDLEVTTETALVFRALSSEALADGAELCRSDVTRKPEHLGFEPRPIKIDRAGVEVQVQIERPAEKIAEAQLLLVICLGSTRWIYMGQLPELGPEDADPEEEETPEATTTSTPPAKEPIGVDQSSPFWDTVRANPWLSSAIALLFVCLLGAAVYLSYDLWGRRRPSPPPVVETSPEPSQAPPPPAPVEVLSLAAIESRFSEALKRDLAPLKDDVREVKSILTELQEGRYYSTAPGSTMETWGGRDTVATGPALSPGSGDGNLSELVNRWWRDGADRDRAALLVQNPFVNAYRSVKIHEDMRNLTNRTFTFQVTDGPMEWLGRQQQGDLLLVPCDQRQFEAGDSLKFLGYLFDGLGKNLAKVRFRRVVRPCRLRREPSAQDRYRLVEKGLLELEGQSEAVSAPLVVQPVALSRVPQENLSTAPEFSEAKLAKVIRGAVSEVIPGDLSVRIEELARQVRSLREREPQKTEPAQPDPSLAAALDGVHRGIGAFEARLQEQATAVREVKSLVEALQGDLLRIETGLRRSDPPAPAAATPSLADPVEESEIEAAMDRLWEVPAQPPPQEPPFVAETPWRPAGPVHVPQKLLDRLAPWWPARLLPPADSSPDGDSVPDPSAYLWRLEETRRVLARAGLEKGWQVSLVHLNVPEGSAQSDSLLEILEPVTVSRDYRSASSRGNPFSDWLLFQFALSVRGDDSQNIAVLPAAGLRVDKHHQAYSRLTLGKLPESVMRITQVNQPAVLSPVGQGGLYTVVSPLKAEFR